MKKRTKVIISLLIIVFLIFLLFFSNKGNGVKYSSASASRGDVLQTVSATGTVEAKKKIDLKFSNSGKIDEINVSTGDSVEEGDVLAKLDVSKLDSQLAQAEAALQTARANLSVLLEGATEEEVKVYETAVVNAQNALNSATSSAEKDVASAKASVESAKTSLQNAQTSLENVKTSNENSLDNAYEDGWNVSLSALIDCDEALNANDTVLNDDDAQDTLSAKNSSYLISSNTSKIEAEDSYELALNFKDSIGGEYSYENIDDLIEFTMQSLVDTRETLSDTSSVLQATITSSDFSQTELDALKSDISLERASINAAISSLTTQKQTISTQKVNNQTSLDSAVSSVSSASSALAVAESNLSSVENSTESNIVLREGDLQKAQDQLTQIKSGPSSAKKASYQFQVEQASANVDLIEKQIEDSIIVAPYDGVITSVSAEIGENISSSEVFISIMIANGFEIEANISEVDIPKVSVGDEVEITFDALGSDQIFAGEISEIDPAETEISGVVYYKVVTIFTDDSSLIKSGMTANLDIMTDKKENVIKIPFQALREKDDDSKYVKVVGSDGEIKDVDVVIGLKGDVEIEVKSGLEDGQEVVTFIEE